MHPGHDADEQMTRCELFRKEALSKYVKGAISFYAVVLSVFVYFFTKALYILLSRPTTEPFHQLTRNIFLECNTNYNSNPAVRFMFAHLKRAGCNVSTDNIECQRCDGQMAGGFQDNGGVVLCANHINTQDHANTTLVHEAVHAFDECRANVDWTNCVHHACSEIRAAALSGDCSFGREVFLRRNFGWGKQFQRCIRRRAELSVEMNPNCDSLAVSIVTPPPHLMITTVAK